MNKINTNPLIIEDLANNKSQLLLNIYFDANFVTCTELISGASFNTFSLIPD